MKVLVTGALGHIGSKLIRELTKIDEEHLDSNEIKNLKKLKKFLVTKYPDLQKHFDQEVLRFAVNQ